MFWKHVAQLPHCILVLSPVKAHVLFILLGHASLGSGAQEADVPSISDALCFRMGDIHRGSDTSASAPPDCTSCASAGVVLKNASYTQLRGCHSPTANVAADVEVVLAAVACGEGTVVPVWGLGARGRGDLVWKSGIATCASRHAARGSAAGYSRRREMKGTLRGSRKALRKDMKQGAGYLQYDRAPAVERAIHCYCTVVEPNGKGACMAANGI